MTLHDGSSDLADELLQLILEHVAADPEKSLTVDQRAYLSQESFKAPPSPSQDQAQTIGNFRLACRRFSEIGARQQFGRVTTRFSWHGFKRLEGISERPHLSKHVRKFSYMVPCFYIEGRQSVQALPPQLQYDAGSFGLDIELFRRKVRDQHEIIRSEEDVRVLKKAMSAFTNLQHVQILRVLDREDDKLLSLIRHHEDLTRPFIELKWAPACVHSTKTIGAALLASHNRCTRFSSPMLSPQSALMLTGHPLSNLSVLAERLTCLELHFDDGYDLDTRMQELGGLFNVVFKAAVNMEAVHVGFPSHRPLSLPLETIFHNVQWKRLVAFGIQGWKLETNEIISIVKRHRERLRGLRLRDVLLKDGSMWKEILGFLRNEMLRLDWVSLRRIGYARPFDDYWANPGIEVPDDPPGGASESDNDSDDLYHTDPETYDHNDDSDFGSDYNSDSEHEREEDSDAEHGPDAHEIEFPSRLNSPDTPNSIPWCNCNGRSYPESVDDLGDDGAFVDNTKRKMWEKWVLGRCPEHDHRF